MKEKPSVAVDFDGVIAYYDDWKGVDHFEDPLPWSKEFLSQLREKFNIIIHTCRCNPEINKPERVNLLVNRIRDFMDKHELPYDEIWGGEGKPIAKFYIDDRAVFVPKNPTRHDYEFVLRKVSHILGDKNERL